MIRWFEPKRIEIFETTLLIYFDNILDCLKRIYSLLESLNYFQISYINL